MSQLEEMQAYVAEVHRGDQYGEYPFSTHLNRCVEILKASGITDENLICAMLAHDVLETHPHRFDEFTDKFNGNIVNLVVHLTHRSHEGYRVYISRLMTCGCEVALFLKLVDVCSNREACQLEFDNSLLSRYATTETRIKLRFYYASSIRFNGDTRTMLKDIASWVVSTQL